ncbi:MAG: transporter permease [Sphaerisporangium sp.]|jgi:peptide/nickel transport system permease protein|nr:transporter permease [Sphaerisporangium sp.]
MTFRPLVRALGQGLAWRVTAKGAQTAIVLLGATVAVFLMVHVVPGDPARAALGAQASPQAVQELHQQLGLDRPLMVQYWSWLVAALHGDLGNSIMLTDPVTALLAQRIGVTAEIAVFALLVSLVLAIPASLVSARWRGAIADRSARVIVLAGIAIPSFWLALLLILAFHSVLPVFGYAPLSDGIWEHFSHLILPSVALGAGHAALVFEINRIGLIEAIQQEYVRTARAHGISERRIFLRYALRNAFLPTITVIGVQAGYLLGGAMLVETVFAIPGMGRLLINAVTARDYPLVQGGVLVTVVIFVAVNLLVDVSYALIDPRIRRRIRG